MRALKKPDLSVGHSCIVDSKFLPEKLRNQLKDHLVGANMSTTQIEGFLDDCGIATQKIVLDREQIGIGKEKTELEAIATNARRLLVSINAANSQTRDTLTAVSEELAFGTNPTVKLPRKVITDVRDGINTPLLALAWDYVQALEQLANYASEQVTPSKQSKPEQVNRKRLTASIVEGYLIRFDALPPADRAGWFAGFMQCLGDHYGVVCGPRIVSGAIAKHQKTR